ncbi:Uncharacterised protein [Halioglobus japonicus]|nr:Uncharacterised protein [Halioglobus japonicus]
MAKGILLTLILALFSTGSYAELPNHQVWDGLLKKHVVEVDGGKATQVDYAGMARDRKELQAYLGQLSRVSMANFDLSSPNDQLAFLINAYNAWTVELILTEYPNIESIKELGSLFQSPWRKKFFVLLGESRSLDDIEHNLIRGSQRYEDPRIHFAVNCASIGCPALRNEAYDAAKLDEQLDDQQQLFLSDRTRNRLQGRSLQVSSIFKWYNEDFEKGWMGVDSLQQFFLQHSGSLGFTADDVSRFSAGKIDIEYLDYDWRLNDRVVNTNN